MEAVFIEFLGGVILSIMIGVILAAERPPRRLFRAYIANYLIAGESFVFVNVVC